MKNHKKLIATTLAGVLVLSSSMVAFATEPKDWNTDGGESTVEGYNTVTQPVIEVALPGELAFELDPFEINSDNQVFGYDYNVVNYSNIDVKIGITPKVAAAEGITDIADGTRPAVNTGKDGYKVEMAADTGGKRAVKFAVIVADKAASALADTNEDGIYEFEYKGTDTILGRKPITYVASGDNAGAVNYTAVTLENGITASAGKDGVVDLTFGTALEKPVEVFLDKAPADWDTKPTEKLLTSVSSFTFVGNVDPHSTFNDGEIVASAKYTLKAYTKKESKLLTDATDGENYDKSTAKQAFIYKKS